MPPIRKPTPPVDVSSLEDSIVTRFDTCCHTLCHTSRCVGPGLQYFQQENLKDYVKSVGTEQAFSFGLYGGIPSGHAVRGKGLLALTVLIEMVLLKTARHMQFDHKQLKTAVLNVSFGLEGLWDRRRPQDRLST